MKTKIINIKAITITILTTFIISIANVGFYANAADSLMDINRTVSVSNVNAGDTFDVKYTITPKPIAASSQDNNKQKEIVFVMDTSGSMKWIVGQNREPYYYGEKSRLDIMKNVAKNFISKFNDGTDKARISLIEYNNKAKIKNNFTNINSNNIYGLNNCIEGLNADGSTNIGDGLRKAYYMLSDNAQGQEKYIVLMTDGEAEAYSSDYYWNYIMDDTERYYDNSTVWKNDWHGNRYADPDYRQQSMEYAKKVASEKISNSNINTFVIGFGNGANGDKNKQIADSAQGTYFQAQDENTINAIYDKIQKIIDTNVNGKVHLEENISSNLEVVDVKNKDLPQDYKIEGNKLMIDVNNYYTLTNGNYTTDPIEFTVKYKVKDNNLCKLGAGGNSSFVKLDVLDKTDTKYLQEKIIGNSVPTQVSMEVSDTTGIIDKYDTVAQSSQSSRYDKADNQYKLLGDSYINIATQGSDINFFQYQFVKSDTKPTDLPNDNWKDIDLTKEEINEDVDESKMGYLTQRSYDVSHLGTISDEAKWNNRQEVFKNPFDATTYKAASYANTKDAYGGWQDYVKTDGSTGKRWVTKSTFMNQMNIGLNDVQNKDYKEASKFWGYIKVPTTGSYNFAATSDDGCSADITVNGSTVKIVDMFKVQGSTSGSTNQTLQLEANRYYPIYIEYFNWGGQAEFRLQYKASTSSSWTNIPQNYFYPSKSTAPGEYATNRFSGRAGIKVPDEVGKYYIAYRTGKRDANNATITDSMIQKSGFYGAFIRDERFVLSRSLTNNGANNIGDIFEINYTINPKDIPVTDIYKNYQSGGTITPKSQLEISDLRIQQVLPAGLTYVGSSNNVNIVNNSNEISGVINSKVVYMLTGSTYKASPVTITIKVKPTISGTFDLLENNSILTYTDISIDTTKQGAQRQANFPKFSLNVNEEYSVILKHGIYDASSTDYINESNLNVVNKIPTALAMLVDVKSSNSVINWSINDIGKISNENSEIVFKQYEISNMSTPVKTVPLNISGGFVSISNNNGFNMAKDTKYIIVYTITPKDNVVGNIAIGANVEGGNSKPITLNIQGLPDLF